MILFLLLALAAGVLLPVQAGLNAQLRSGLGSPVAAALVSFLVGTAGLATIALLLRTPLPLGRAWLPPSPWQWSGGLIGAGARPVWAGRVPSPLADAGPPPGGCLGNRRRDPDSALSLNSFRTRSLMMTYRLGGAGQ